MFTKREAPQLGNQLPEMLDEGWWASVLADEVTVDLTSAEPVQRSVSSTNLEGVDWDRVQELFDGDEIIELEVHGFNRGGLLVQGEVLHGFVPVSHLVDIPSSIDEEERQRRLNEYVGRLLQLKVIECEPTMERIVLSERAAQAGKGKRKQLFRMLKPGETVSGTVTNVTDFGVFVDLGGVEGLIHVSELSWGRVQHPSDILNVGETVKTLVLQVCEENSRVALSLKRLVSNPWDNLVANYHAGDVVPATVTSIMRYGVFARLDEGVEGLIHISSIEQMSGQKDISKFLSVGERVQVRILHIDAGRRRLGLGLVSCE